MFSKEIIVLDDSRWFLKYYLKIQIGESLSPKSPIHKSILLLLKKHYIDYEKVKDLDNPSLGDSLGPTLDPRVELELEEEEELKEKETLKEKVKKEKAIILPINTEAGDRSMLGG